MMLGTSTSSAAATKSMSTQTDCERIKDFKRRRACRAHSSAPAQAQTVPPVLSVRSTVAAWAAVMASTLSSSDAAAALKRAVLPPNARSVLALGGSESLDAWWQEDLHVTHAAMGPYYKSLVSARIPVQVLHWEPCQHASNASSLGRSLPLPRWSVDAVVLSESLCTRSLLQGATTLEELAHELDRILRPGGTVLSEGSWSWPLFQHFRGQLGWPKVAKHHALAIGPKEILLSWGQRPAVGNRGRVKLPQCSLGLDVSSPTASSVAKAYVHSNWAPVDAERGFCSLPASTAPTCVFDPPTSCPRGVTRPSHAELTNGSSFEAMGPWRQRTYFACTLPGSFHALGGTSDWGLKYMSDYGSSKRNEWMQCYEDRAVRQLPLPRATSLPCP